VWTKIAGDQLSPTGSIRSAKTFVPASVDALTKPAAM
jgi:hypothetical protein